MASSYAVALCSANGGSFIRNEWLKTPQLWLNSFAIIIQQIISLLINVLSSETDTSQQNIDPFRKKTNKRNGE
ncbi:hypothetical protein ACFFHM_05750 [Halalkalibacter kiskunsagensis]|uniref:Uncharacterized protein n=1 Tax=Halalkalibacter kiskunsagensis TaxID=1548599 RepID=A0ABV6KAT3_9BACI